MGIGVVTIASDTRRAEREASVASIWPVAMRCDAMGLPSAAAQCKCKQWSISGGGGCGRVGGEATGGHWPD